MLTTFFFLALLSNPSELAFNLEMTLGSEDSEDHFLFSADTFFTVQNSGSIAILDAGNKHVSIFSNKGEFLVRTGGEGQGPGEFTSPSEITHDAQDNLYVFDAQALKITLFDAQGTYQKTMRLPIGTVGLIQPVILGNGNILLSSVRLNEEQQQVYMLALHDSNMQVIKTISTRAQPVLDWNESGSPTFWVEFLKDHLESIGKGIPLAAATVTGFVSVNTNSYGGVFWDNSGVQIGNFERKYRPLMMSDEMKEAKCEEAYQKVATSGEVAQFIPHGVFVKAMAKAELPTAVNPITHLFSTETGYGVLHNYDSVKQHGRIELFNEKGQFLKGGVYKGPAAAIKWSNRNLYTMGEDEDGVRVLNRYNVEGAMVN